MYRQWAAEARERALELLARKEEPTQDALAIALADVAFHGDVESAKALLSRGADPNRVAEGKHWGAMHMAVENLQPECLKHLIDHGGNVNLGDASGWTPLHLAIDSEADCASQVQIKPVPKMTAILLRNGADPLAKDSRGRTPIDLASDYQYQEALALMKAALE